MNDISASRPSMPISFEGSRAISKATIADGSGNKLPESSSSETKIDAPVKAEAAIAIEAAEVKKDRDAASKELAQAVETANEFVQNVQRDLHFSIDDETDRTVVKVVESSSGDIIRQIPDETFLELARKMKEHGEIHLVNATG